MKKYLGWWLHTLYETGRIQRQGQITHVGEIDSEVRLYSWVMGEQLDKTMIIANTALEDPKLVRLYPSNADMNAAYKEAEADWQATHKEEPE